MRDEHLENLIRHADVEAAPARLPPDLPQRVRIAYGRRRRVRRVGATAGVACAVLAVMIATVFRGDMPARSGVAPAHVAILTDDAGERIRVELALLRVEADARARLASRLEDIETRQARRVRADRVLAGPSARDRLIEGRDRAAGIMVHHAERLARRADAAEQAARAYQRVIDLFPDSDWATDARRGVEALDSKATPPRSGRLDRATESTA